MFRDGRTSTNPKLGVHLHISDDDWAKLTAVLKTFAAENGLSFRDGNVVRYSRIEWLGVSLCSDDGFNFHGSPGDGATGISIYEVNEGSGWLPMARKLITDLKKNWPNRVLIKDREGYIIPKSKQ